MVCLPCIQWPCRGRVVWYVCLVFSGLVGDVWYVCLVFSGLVGDVWCGMFAL